MVVSPICNGRIRVLRLALVLGVALFGSLPPSVALAQGNDAPTSSSTPSGGGGIAVGPGTDDAETTGSSGPQRPNANATNARWAVPDEGPACSIIRDETARKACENRVTRH